MTPLSEESIERSEPRWYAVQTRSRFEKVVSAELGSKGVENYLPLNEEFHHWQDRKKLVHQPIFPGYVFARFVDHHSARLAVLRSNGAVRILGSGGSLESVTDTEIVSIQRLLQSGKQFCSNPFLREGSWVRVRRGPLKGIEGLLVQMKNRSRLVLSVNLLSQSVATEVDSCDVEVVPRRSAQLTVACPR